MSMFSIYRLNHLSVVDVSGADCSTIVHNLTTNEVKALAVGEGRETFITNVRGKTLGHVCLFKQDHGLRLIGPSGQSEVICAQVDRYTIREDVKAEIRDSDYVGFVITPELAEQCGFGCVGETVLKSLSLDKDAASVTLQGVAWLGEKSVLMCVQADQAERFFELLAAAVLKML